MRILNLEPEGYSPEAQAILESIGEVVDNYFYLSDSDAILTRLEHQLDRKFLDDCPACKVIVSPTTGLDHIDLDYCRERGIEVISLKGERDFLRGVPATAELTWGLILSLLRNIPQAAESVKQGQWDRDQFRGHDLAGKTLGIIGLGRIGTMVAKYAEAFGMKVISHDPFNPESTASLWTVLHNSDIVSVHIPLNDETEQMLSWIQLQSMTRHSFLVNTSRGEIVDEAALLDCLRQKWIAGAALDVICNERGEHNPELLEYARTHDNLIITPHIGGATYESMAKAEIFTAKKLAEWAKRTGQN